VRLASCWREKTKEKELWGGVLQGRSRIGGKGKGKQMQGSMLGAFAISGDVGRRSLDSWGGR